MIEGDVKMQLRAGMENGVYEANFVITEDVLQEADGHIVSHLLMHIDEVLRNMLVAIKKERGMI